MRGSTALGLSIGATLVACVTAVAIAVVGREVPQSVTASSPAVFVEAMQTQTDEAQPATVTLTREPAEVVRSAGGQGLVTSVHAEPGQSVAEGDEVYALDGVVVHALVSPTPLFRTLQLSDEGADVSALQGYLSRHVDPSVAVSGRFDRATRRAVQTLETQLGVDRTGVAQPWWFVRISASLVVGSVHVFVGTPAPQVGATVLQSVAAVARISVTADRTPADGEYVLTNDGGTFALTLSGQSWTSADPAALMTAAEASSPGAAPADGADAQPTSLSIEGRLALSTPINVVVVPAAALLAAIDSETACVWARQAGGGSAPQLLDGVRVVGTAPSGAALVDSDPRFSGVEVLLDPETFVEEATCP